MWKTAKIVSQRAAQKLARDRFSRRHNLQPTVRVAAGGRSVDGFFLQGRLVLADGLRRRPILCSLAAKPACEERAVRVTGAMEESNRIAYVFCMACS
jgi:hypothetical protein